MHFPTAATALCIASGATALCPTRVVYEYPQNHTWFENLAVRRNGSILITPEDHPNHVILSINPFDNSSATTVAYLPGNASLGITEGAPDVFYAINTNENLDPPSTASGLTRIYKLDFTCNNTHGLPGVSELATFPDHPFLNGLTTFNETLLLAADSANGSVIAVDTVTGKYWTIAHDPLMAPRPTGDLAEGINGVRFLNGTLHFLTSQQHLYASIELDENAEPISNASLIAYAEKEKGVWPNWDDFALTKDGVAYAATEQGQSIQRISRNGTVEVIAGGLNSTDVLEPSSAQFGRTEKDKNTLYVTSTGGYVYPAQTVNGPVSGPARILAIDLDGPTLQC